MTVNNCFEKENHPKDINKSNAHAQKGFFSKVEDVFLGENN